MDNTERVAQSRTEHDGSAPPFQTDDIQLLRHDQFAKLVLVLCRHADALAEFAQLRNLQ